MSRVRVGASVALRLPVAGRVHPFGLAGDEDTRCRVERRAPGPPDQGRGGRQAAPHRGSVPVRAAGPVADFCRRIQKRGCRARHRGRETFPAHPGRGAGKGTLLRPACEQRPASALRAAGRVAGVGLPNARASTGCLLRSGSLPRLCPARRPQPPLGRP